MTSKAPVTEVIHVTCLTVRGAREAINFAARQYGRRQYLIEQLERDAALLFKCEALAAVPGATADIREKLSGVEASVRAQCADWEKQLQALDIELKRHGVTFRSEARYVNALTAPANLVEVPHAPAH